LALRGGIFCMNAVIRYLLSEFRYNHEHRLSGSASPRVGLTVLI
jgi:hypothetical protein